MTRRTFFLSVALALCGSDRRTDQRTYRRPTPAELHEHRGEWDRDCVPYVVHERNRLTGRMVDRFGWGPPKHVEQLLKG